MAIVKKVAYMKNISKTERLGLKNYLFICRVDESQLFYFIKKEMIYMKLENYQDLIDICIKAKECNRDIALELTVPGQEGTEIIIVKNSNIDYKLDYYLTNYNENLELNRCKEIKLLNAEIVMWGTMLAGYKIDFK